MSRECDPIECYRCREFTNFLASNGKFMRQDVILIAYLCFTVFSLGFLAASFVKVNLKCVHSRVEVLDGASVPSVAQIDESSNNAAKNTKNSDDFREPNILH